MKLCMATIIARNKELSVLLATTGLTPCSLQLGPHTFCCYRSDDLLSDLLTDGFTGHPLPLGPGINAAEMRRLAEERTAGAGG